MIQGKVIRLREYDCGRAEKREYFRERIRVMARLARVVAVDVPHQVTQRGNARRFMADCDADRKVYLDLLREDIESCKLALTGYCLMSNHVHLVVVPKEANGLARAP
jgi:putative transposase